MSTLQSPGQLHKFESGALDATKCKICRTAETDHNCQVCGNPGSVMMVYGSILMCPACKEKEDKMQAEINLPENQARRVSEMNAAMDAARNIDSSIRVHSDIFNAKTIAILELKKIIDENPSIENKPYALASELSTRFTHLQTVIFEKNKEIADMANEQKAIQVYLNTLANQLREEERAKLKLSDINYKPKEVKTVKPAAIKTAKKSGKLDKAELAKYAKELGIAEFTLQMLCVSKGITPEQAAGMLRKSLNEAKSEVSPTITNTVTPPAPVIPQNPVVITPIKTPVTPVQPVVNKPSIADSRSEVHSTVPSKKAMDTWNGLTGIEQSHFGSFSKFLESWKDK